MFVLSVVIGCGLGLYFNGRSNDSSLKKVSGIAFVAVGVILFALKLMVEAKKADVI